MDRRTLGERSFQYIGPVISNSLPLPVRHLSSLSPFKSKLKTCLFSSAYEHSEWLIKAVTKRPADLRNTAWSKTTYWESCMAIHCLDGWTDAEPVGLTVTSSLCTLNRHMNHWNTFTLDAEPQLAPLEHVHFGRWTTRTTGTRSLLRWAATCTTGTCSLWTRWTTCTTGTCSLLRWAASCTTGTRLLWTLNHMHHWNMFTLDTLSHGIKLWPEQFPNQNTNNKLFATPLTYQPHLFLRHSPSQPLQSEVIFKLMKEEKVESKQQVLSLNAQSVNLIGYIPGRKN